MVAGHSGVDAASISAMALRMAFRGPDGVRTLVSPGVGLGHAWLRTRDEAPQPLALGTLLVSADARLDAREQLVAELGMTGHACTADASEPELIAHAYAAWGEKCVEHLAGDFAFAIWDTRTRVLFCARDHFGVKPLFYAGASGRVLVSNTLDAIRLDSGVSAELDDLAIADFLMFDAAQDPASTAFAAIRRLPPAHCMTVREGVIRVQRYWKLSRDHGVRYRDRGDYIAHFTHLLDQAVADRLRTDRLSIAMSGGLDSTALAASALRVARAGQRPLAVKAHTIVYDSLIPDRERHFSQVAADAMGIPIAHRAADGYGLFAGTDDPCLRFAEPSHEPEGAGAWDLLRDQAAFARVSLMGWDGDALLRESPKPYLRTLWSQRRFARFATDAAWYALHERRLIPRSVWPASRLSDSDDPVFPEWINTDLQRRLRLRDRWRDVLEKPAVTHELRPYAHAMLAGLDHWSNFFDRFDAGFTRLHLELRHPFLDLRLVNYCLSLPPVPWCVHKRILRESLAGVLPEEVRQRPKSHLGVPGLALLARDDARWVDDFVASSRLERYIQRERIPRVWGSDRPSAWPALRPLTLHFWLQHQFSKSTEEVAA